MKIGNIWSNGSVSPVFAFPERKGQLGLKRRSVEPRSGDRVEMNEVTVAQHVVGRGMFHLRQNH